MPKSLLSPQEVDELRIARWKARTNLGYLCREILGYKDVDDYVHGPLIATLQKFPKPRTREAFNAHDQWNGKTWIYKPLFNHIQDLPGGRRRLILDARGHLKCLHPETLVNLADGSYKKAAALSAGDVLWGIEDRTFRPVHTTVEALELQEPQETYKICFRSGREILVSHNHPIRTMLDWVKAENIAVGDRVAVVNKRPTSGPDVPEAFFLGAMIGDGCFPLMSFTNNSVDFMNAMREETEKLGGSLASGYYLKSNEIRILGLRDLVRTHGLLDTKSGTKFVPTAIFKASDHSVLQFLKAYFWADGTLGPNGIGWTSKSKTLADDIRRLLGRFGVTARVRPVTLRSGPYKGNTYYYGYISGRENVKKILGLIGWMKPHKWVDRENTNLNIDLVPKEWRSLYPKYFFSRGEKPAWLKDRWTLKNGNQRSLSTYDAPKEYLADLGEALNDERLRTLGSDLIFWDQVEKIEHLGKIPTFAVQTSTENFCVDDVVTHNTTINVQAHIIQWIINYPGLAAAIFQSSGDKAMMILDEIKNHFKWNDVFRRVFPEHCPQKNPQDWGTKEQFTTEGRPRNVVRREPTVLALAIDKNTAGLHFDVIKFSDIVEPENTKTKDRLEQVKKSFYLAQSLLVSPSYWVDVEGTRYHAADLYGDMLENYQKELESGHPTTYQTYTRSVFKRKGPDGLEQKIFTPETLEWPFLLDSNGREIPWWEKDVSGAPRFTWEDLNKERREDAYVFSCQKLLVPQAAEAGKEIFPESKLLKISRKDFQNNVAGKIVHYTIGLDTAETSTTRSDHTAFVVVGWDTNNRAWVREIVREKFLPKQIVDKLFELNFKYKPSAIFIEETGFVRGLRVSIEREWQTKRALFERAQLALPLQFIKPENDKSKQERIQNTLQPYYVGGLLRFVVPDDGDKLGQGYWRALISELRGFPLGKSDDILDALADQFQNKEWFGRLMTREGVGVAVAEDFWNRRAESMIYGGLGLPF